MKKKNKSQYFLDAVRLWMTNYAILIQACILSGNSDVRRVDSHLHQFLNLNLRLSLPFGCLILPLIHHCFLLPVCNIYNTKHERSVVMKPTGHIV